MKARLREKSSIKNGLAKVFVELLAMGGIQLPHLALLSLCRLNMALVYIGTVELGYKNCPMIF